MTARLITSARDRHAASATDPLNATIAAYDLRAGDFRERLLAADMSPLVDEFVRLLPTGGTVLDAGCGPGRDLREFASRGYRVVGIDLSKRLLQYARSSEPRATVVMGDLRDLPFQNSSFDGTWFCASLLHLDSMGFRSAVREAFRVLKPGGRFFASLAAGDGESWGGPEGGMRWFNYHTPRSVEAALLGEHFEIPSLQTEPGVVRGTWVNAFAMKPKSP